MPADIKGAVFASVSPGALTLNPNPCTSNTQSQTLQSSKYTSWTLDPAFYTQNLNQKPKLVQTLKTHNPMP